MHIPFVPYMFIVVMAGFMLTMLTGLTAHAQTDSLILPAPKQQPVIKASEPKKVLYGLASYYANSFHGKRTANGEIFSQDKFTAACNVLPLGTWIRVTNLKNGKTVTVRTTDRLHPRMKRIVDLSRIAAQKLGYIKQGLTRVKVEVLSKP